MLMCLLSRGIAVPCKNACGTAGNGNPKVAQASSQPLHPKAYYIQGFCRAVQGLNMRFRVMQGFCKVTTPRMEKQSDLENEREQTLNLQDL